MKSFDEYFEKTGDNDCWLWEKGRRNKAGYGNFYRGRVNGKATMTLAHRFAWERANRPLRPKEIIMHLCDNPPCVNPAHLQVGTHSENTRDAIKKHGGWGSIHGPGEKHGNARLTEADIYAIRALAQQMTARELGERFGVSRLHINDIVARRRWAHVA